MNDERDRRYLTYIMEAILLIERRTVPVEGVMRSFKTSTPKTQFSGD